MWLEGGCFGGGGGGSRNKNVESEERGTEKESKEVTWTN